MLLFFSGDRTILFSRVNRVKKKNAIDIFQPLHTLDGGEEINALCFSPNRYWLCAAAGPVIKIWDLEQKTIVEELKPEVMGQPPQCISICWSSDGQTLFSGYTDGLIRVWSLSVRASALL